MTVVRGYCYASGASTRDACELQLTDAGIYELRASDGECLASGMFHTLEISSRLGDTPRFLTFPHGLRLETSDNALIDRLLAQHAPGSRATWLHRLESRKRFVLLTLLVVIAFVWGLARYGAPTTARLIAPMVPQAVLEVAGEQSLAALDQLHFQSSTLPEAVQQRVRDHLQPQVAAHPQLQLRVLFRSSDRLGANAFALPDGTIVFTDAMVELAENDDELLAVFAHEIGHVEQRHAARRVIQSAMLTFLAVALTGDMSGTSELFLGIPVLLTELAYSREFEREADRYAFALLQRQGKSPTLFADIMGRLEQSHRCQDDDTDCDASGQPRSDWANYLSSHPPTAERRATVDANPLPAQGR